MVHKKEKIYIDMTMLCSKNGTISPIAFAWKDGTMYHIENVLERQILRTDDKGRNIYRFKCKVKGRIKYLFNDDGKWYVEV